MVKYSLTDFNRYGKVELARLIFATADVDYKDNFIENLTDSDTQFSMMPYLNIDETKIPLISVVCRYLAREFNLAGKNNIEQAQTDAISQTCMLLIDNYYNNVFNVEDMDQKKINLKAFLSDNVETTADAIETLIKMYSKTLTDAEYTYSVGDNLTYADLFIYEMVQKYFPKEMEFIQRFPKLYKVKATVELDKRLNSYFEKQPKITQDYINIC